MIGVIRGSGDRKSEEKAMKICVKKHDLESRRSTKHTKERAVRHFLTDITIAVVTHMGKTGGKRRDAANLIEK